MWMIRWILGALFFLAMVLFAVQNQDPKYAVPVNFLTYRSQNMPVWQLLFIGFGTGVLFWLLISIVDVLKTKSDIHKLRRENRKIKEELNRLRNASIDEDLEPTEMD